MRRRQREAASSTEQEESQKRRREIVLILLVAITFISFLFFEYRLVKISSSLPFVNSIFFFGLMNLNVILLGTLIWLIVRNIGKLFLERRSKMLGARLKTKLVMAFLSFSIGPTLTLFLISALYINSSFDQWFSLRVRNTLQSSLEITRTYYRNADRTALYFARSIAARMSQRVSGRFQRSLERNGNLIDDVRIPGWVPLFLEEQRKTFALTALEFYPSAFQPKVSAVESADSPNLPLPDRYPSVALEVLDATLKGENNSSLLHLRNGDLIRALAPLKVGGKVMGAVVVTTFIPVSLVNKVDEIANVFDDFEETNPLEFPIKTVYFVILLMITLLIIFVAIWIGLYLARQLTGPVEKLVQGVREVGAGNLDFSIKREGHDEISVLVDSFNRMTADLKTNRARLDQANRGIEERRRQLEAVLANIGAGVISFDRNQVIKTMNPAAARLLDLKTEELIESPLAKLSEREPLKPLSQLIERTFSATEDNAQSMDLTQWAFQTEGEEESAAKQLAAVATPVQDERGAWGVVVVIDDLSHVVKAQREVAWREVARRIAHEIKNPLTPIKLSAQRIKRRLGDLDGPDGALIRECTDTIVQHTDELKEMVNEFSSFARLPQASPAPHQLTEVVDEVVNLYQTAHPEIEFEKLIPQTIPVFEFDRDQIKRVLINLVENAVAATAKRSSRRITVQCRMDSSLQLLRLIVQDNGMGMDEATQARIFEPYFSTKQEGTGLGLAIAKRIVTDHDGFVRVTSSESMGTEFVIELPMKRPSVESGSKAP
jgi:two-component system nitrogen regulation sensor histidine kinase NtrY